MIVFYNFSSEAISLQYKWSCKHKKQPLFQKFYLRAGGITALLKEISLKFKLSYLL